MILAALFLSTVLAANFDTWGEMNRGFLSKGCLKDGTWDKMIKTSGYPSYSAEECASASTFHNGKLFSVRDGKCWVSTSLEYTTGMGCFDEDVYVVFPRERTSGVAQVGDMSCTEFGGDGEGVSEKNIGTTSSLQACAKKVAAEQSTANGATWKKQGGACYAEFGMKGVDKNAYHQYSTCYVVVALGRGERGNARDGDGCNHDEDCQVGLTCQRKRRSYSCRPAVAEEDAQAETMQMTESRPLVVVYGFAMLGLGAMLYGAGRYYCVGKEENMTML